MAVRDLALSRGASNFQVLIIIATPTGEAPEWVRDAWVGCKFTEFTEPHKYEGREGFMSGVLGGKPDDENFGGYGIMKQLAIDTLFQRNQDAALWWIENTGFMGDLIFGQKFCKIITVNE